MAISRRNFCALLILATASGFTHGGIYRRRRTRRRIVRRRIRRPVNWRVVRGRQRLIVPRSVAVGWELVVDNRVVVVKEVHRETIVVLDSDGNQTELDIIKEDTAENSRQLEGSEYEVIEGQ